MARVVHAQHRLKLAEACQELVIGQRLEKLLLAYEHEVDVTHSHLSEDLPPTLTLEHIFALTIVPC